MFKDKVLLITGGTGSFGSTLLRKFANSDLKEIRVFSRDEKKQEDLRIELKNDKINFIIGDVRDFDPAPAKIIHPNPEMADFYEKKFERYLKCYEAGC